MSTPRQKGFYLWRCLPDGRIIKLGALAIEQLPNGRLQLIQFKYDSAYLNDNDAIPLDPLHAPLQSEMQSYDTAGRYLPGFIDDCLPDDWGKRIVAARLGLRHVDTLTLMMNLEGAAMGDVKITPARETSTPQWPGGLEVTKLDRLADAIWQDDWKAMTTLDGSLALLLNGGSRVGGARPKLLIKEGSTESLAKFNRSQDRFDMAGVEWACMKVVAAAGLAAAEVEIGQLASTRYLKVKRFDITEQGGRYHLLSCNALLKDLYTQDDPHQGRYEDIADIIRRYCDDPAKDLEQLFGQLLINSALHNTDDHLRNFSLLHNGIGWQLSPAYDIVPDDSLGAYHQISFRGKPFLPTLTEAAATGKALGLDKSASVRVTEQVAAALKQWPVLLEQAKVSGPSYDRLVKMIK